MDRLRQHMKRAVSVKTGSQEPDVDDQRSKTTRERINSLHELAEHSAAMIQPSQNAFPASDAPRRAWNLEIGARPLQSRYDRDEHMFSQPSSSTSHPGDVQPQSSTPYAFAPPRLMQQTQSEKKPLITPQNSGPLKTSRSWGSKLINSYKAATASLSPSKTSVIGRARQDDTMPAIEIRGYQDGRALIGPPPMRRAYPTDPADIVHDPDSSLAMYAQALVDQNKPTPWPFQSSSNDGETPTTEHHSSTSSGPRRRMRTRDDDSWKKGQPSRTAELPSTSGRNDPFSARTMEQNIYAQSPTSHLVGARHGKEKRVPVTAQEPSHLQLQKSATPTIIEHVSNAINPIGRFIRPPPIEVSSSKPGSGLVAYNNNYKNNPSEAVAEPLPSPTRRMMSRLMDLASKKPVPVLPTTPRNQVFDAGRLPPGVSPTRADHVLTTALGDSRHAAVTSPLNTSRTSIQGLDLALSCMHPLARSEFAVPRSGTQEARAGSRPADSIAGAGRVEGHPLTPVEESEDDRVSIRAADPGLGGAQRQSPPTPPSKDSTYVLLRAGQAVGDEAGPNTGQHCSPSSRYSDEWTPKAGTARTLTTNPLEAHDSLVPSPLRRFQTESEAAVSGKRSLSETSSHLKQVLNDVVSEEARNKLSVVIANLATVLCDFTETVGDTQDAISEAKLISTSRRSEIMKLQSKMGDLVRGQRVLLQELRVFSHELEGISATQEATARRSETDIQDFRRDITSAVHMLREGFEQQVESIRQEMGASTQHMNNLRRAVGARTLAIDSLQEQVNTCAGHINDFKQQLIACSDRVRGLEQQVGVCSERIKGLDEKVGAFTEQNDGLEQRFAGLEHKFDGLEQKVAGLEQKVGGLEQKIDACTDRLDSLQQQVGTVTQRINDLYNQSTQTAQNMDNMTLQLNRVAHTVNTISIHLVASEARRQGQQS